MEVTRANETMIRAVVVFVGGGRSEAQRPSLPFRRLEAAEVVFRGMSPGAAIR